MGINGNAIERIASEWKLLYSKLVLGYISHVAIFSDVALRRQNSHSKFTKKTPMLMFEILDSGLLFENFYLLTWLP
jgi:hypothetical protein